jgi:hypothetical protein
MMLRKLARLIVIGGSTLLILALVVLNCSGLLFPLWGVQGNLERSFQEDFGVPLPASAKAVKGVYVAEMDKSEFFWVEMAPSEVAAWAVALEAAAKSKGHSIEDAQLDKRFTIGKGGPAWYAPQTLPNMKALKIGIPAGDRSSATGYWLFYSPTTGRVLIYWYST